MTPLRIVAPAQYEAIVAAHLPDGCAARWFADAEQAAEYAANAEIGWFDMPRVPDRLAAIAAATGLKWLNTVVVGLDELPIEELRRRGVRITNGRGLNSATIADFALMGMLALAKGLPAILQAQGRAEWLRAPAGQMELEDSRALIFGLGTIGGLIARRLEAFGVAVTGVRRTPSSDPGTIGPEEWRQRIGEFDWIILAAPATDETRALLGAAEFAAMKPGVRIINIARGELIDQVVLRDRLISGDVAGAFLEATTPEPLPPGDPLWTAPNVIISPHIAGRSQTSRVRRAAERFVANVENYRAGRPLEGTFDMARAY